jgi:hypothetical protein
MTRSDRPRVCLAQVRFVSTEIEPIAAFYAELLGISVPLNEHYVEVPASPASVGFSKAGSPRTGARTPRARQAWRPKKEKPFSTSPPTTSTPNIRVSKLSA